MAPPIYFLSRRSQAEMLDGEKVRPSFFASVGLGDVFRDVRFRGQMSMFDHAAGGPDGGHGLLISANGRGGRLSGRFGYYPNTQTWTDLGNGLWMGYAPDEKPTPEDLERSNPFKGLPVVIEDQAWVVPVVRRFNNTSGLPSRAGWNSEGKFETAIKEEYRAIWEATAPACALILGQKPAVNLETMVELALRGLALNYRIGRAEQTAFGPIDNVNWEPLVAAMLDLDWALAMADVGSKKKQDAS